MSEISSNIDQLFGLANSALSTARTTASRITGSGGVVNDINSGYTVPDFKLDKPRAVSDMIVADDTSYRLKFLDGETDKWMAKYFPEMEGCLKTEPERWLCGIITGQKPFGLSEDYFRTVWLQSRDREYRARNSAVSQLKAEFSARGFSLPQGAMIHAISQAEHNASDAISAVNIAQALKDSEIKLDLLKFAEEQSLELKRGMMAALADYVNAMIELPNKSLEESRLRADAYRSLNSAVSDYYRVELGFEQLRLSAEELRMNGIINTHAARAKLDNIDSKNQATGQATKAFADVAASAANAAGTLQANITTGY